MSKIKNKNYGLLKVFTRAGDNFTVVPLCYQVYKIGSDEHATIKVCRPDVDPIHCEVRIMKSTGLAVLINHSGKNPVPINNKPVPKEMFLLPNDSFWVMGKRFLYENDQLSPKVLEEARKRNLENIKKVKSRVSLPFPLSTTKRSVIAQPALQREKKLLLGNEGQWAQTSFEERVAPTKSTHFRNFNGFEVSTPGSAIKPSQRNAAIFENLATLNFKDPECDGSSGTASSPAAAAATATSSSSSSSNGQREETFTTPAREECVAGEDKEEEEEQLQSTADRSELLATTPLNNTSVVVVTSEEDEHETPLRSRKSRARELAMQRLTQNDDSLVTLDSPEYKTPKSTMKSARTSAAGGSSSGSLIRTKLLDEYVESDGEATPAEETPATDGCGDICTDDVIDFDVEEVVVCESTLETSGETPLANDDVDLTQQSKDAMCEEFSSIANAPTRDDSALGFDDATESLIDFSVDNCGFNSILCSTPEIKKVVRRLKKEAAENSATSVTSNETTPEILTGVKRKRDANETQEAFRKRLKCTDAESSSDIYSFASETPLDGDECEEVVEQLQPQPTKKCMSEPRSAKCTPLAAARRSSSERASTPESAEPAAETGSTTLETVDTSSFVYVRNNVSFESVDEFVTAANTQQKKPPSPSSKEAVNDSACLKPRPLLEDVTVTTPNKDTSLTEPADTGATSVFDVSGVSALCDDVDTDDIFPMRKVTRTYGKTLSATSVSTKTPRKCDGASTDVEAWVEHSVAQQRTSLGDGGEDESSSIILDTSDVKATIDDGEGAEVSQLVMATSKSRARSLPATNPVKQYPKARKTEGALSSTTSIAASADPDLLADLELSPDEDECSVFSPSLSLCVESEESVLVDEETAAQSEQQDQSSDFMLEESTVLDKETSDSNHIVESNEADQSGANDSAADTAANDKLTANSTLQKSAVESTEEEDQTTAECKFVSKPGFEILDEMRERLRQSLREAKAAEELQPADEVKPTGSENAAENDIELPVVMSKKKSRKSLKDGMQMVSPRLSTRKLFKKADSDDKVAIVADAVDTNESGTIAEKMADEQPKKSPRKSMKQVAGVDGNRQFVEEVVQSAKKKGRKPKKANTSVTDSKIDEELQSVTSETHDVEDAADELMMVLKKSSQSLPNITIVRADVDVPDEVVVDQLLASSQKNPTKSSKKTDSTEKIKVEEESENIETNATKSIEESEPIILKKGSRKSVKNVGVSGNESNLTEKVPIVASKTSPRKSMKELKKADIFAESPTEEGGVQVKDVSGQQVLSSKKPHRKSLKHIAEADQFVADESIDSSTQPVESDDKIIEADDVVHEHETDEEQSPPIVEVPEESATDKSDISMRSSTEGRTTDSEEVQNKVSSSDLLHKTEDNAVNSSDSAKSDKESCVDVESSVVSSSESVPASPGQAVSPRKSSRKRLPKASFEDYVMELTRPRATSAARNLADNFSGTPTTPAKIRQTPESTSNKKRGRKPKKQAVETDSNLDEECDVIPDKSTDDDDAPASSPHRTVKSSIIEDSATSTSSKQATFQPVEAFVTPVKMTPTKGDHLFKTPICTPVRSAKKPTKAVESLPVDEGKTIDTTEVAHNRAGTRRGKARAQNDLTNANNNDLTNPVGLKKLFRTPRVQKGPTNDLSSPKGLKKLLRTPAQQKEPNNDLSDPTSIRQLWANEPKNDLTDVDGVAELMATVEQTLVQHTIDKAKLLPRVVLTPLPSLTISLRSRTKRGARRGSVEDSTPEPTKKAKPAEAETQPDEEQQPVATIEKQATRSRKGAARKKEAQPSAEEAVVEVPVKRSRRGAAASTDKKDPPPATQEVKKVTRSRRATVEETEEQPMPTATRARRARKVEKHQAEAVEDSKEAVVAEVVVVAPVRKLGRKLAVPETKVAAADSSTPAGESEQDTSAPPTKAPPKRGRRKQQVATEDAAGTPTPQKPATRARRGKVASTIVVEDEEQKSVQAVAAPATSKQAAKRTRRTPQQEMTVSSESDNAPATKRMRSKKATNVSAADVAEATEVEEVVTRTKHAKGITVTTVSVRKKVAFAVDEQPNMLVLTPRPPASKRRLRTEDEMNMSDIGNLVRKTRSRK